MNRSKLTIRSMNTFPGYIVTRHSPTLTISYLRLLEAISCSWRHTKERRISLCPYVRRAFFRVWIEWTRREIRRRIFNDIDVKPIFHFIPRTLSPTGSFDEWNSLLCTEYGRKWSKIPTITIRRELASRQRENWERKWLWDSTAWNTNREKLTCCVDKVKNKERDSWSRTTYRHMGQTLTDL